MPQYASFNGEIKENAQMFLHASDLSIHRAYAVFDYFKLEGGKNLWIDWYLDRFYNSANLAHILIEYTREELKSFIDQLVDKNENHNGGIKIIATAGYSEDGYSKLAKSNLLIFNPIFQLADPDIYRLGANLITDKFRRPMPEIKSTFYMRSAILAEQMKFFNAVDVLFYDEDGVYETSRCNIYFVIEDCIVTPAQNILKGITRQRLLAMTDLKYSIVERSMFIEELKTASEVFISSSSKGIFPIVNIDGNEVGNGLVGPVAKYLATRISV